MIVNAAREQCLLYEYSREELAQMSEQEKEDAYAELKQLERENAYIADCERQMMKTCPQAVDPINY